jgi:hypothetical protein
VIVGVRAIASVRARVKGDSEGNRDGDSKGNSKGDSEGMRTFRGFRTTGITAIRHIDLLFFCTANESLPRSCRVYRSFALISFPGQNRLERPEDGTGDPTVAKKVGTWVGSWH